MIYMYENNYNYIDVPEDNGGKKNSGKGAGKTIAMILAVAIVGGASGFGGAYLHAYGAGVDFIKLIKNNLNGIENIPVFGNYEDDIVMMMYDSVIIEKL